jgi:hypothetical protein
LEDRGLKVHDVFVTMGASNHAQNIREINDYYATHPTAVEKLLQRESFSHKILEPCCGGGHISKVLLEHGYDVVSTDLIDRGFGVGGIDFLQHTTVDCDIVTNPPYKIGLEIVQHALEIVTPNHKVAMLLKIQFLESKSRRKFFDIYPPKYVYVFSERTNCAKNGEFEKSPSSAICYAWYIWVKGERSEPIIRWL